MLIVFMLLGSVEHLKISLASSKLLECSQYFCTSLKFSDHFSCLSVCRFLTVVSAPDVYSDRSSRLDHLRHTGYIGQARTIHQGGRQSWSKTRALSRCSESIYWFYWKYWKSMSLEAFIGGYPKGMDFGIVLGSRSPEGREEFRK